jgi:hypothetical protein
MSNITKERPITQTSVILEKERATKQSFYDHPYIPNLKSKSKTRHTTV